MASRVLTTARSMGRLGRAPATSRSMLLAPSKPGSHVSSRPWALRSFSASTGKHRSESAKPKRSLTPRPFSRVEGFDALDTFARRHIGPSDSEVGDMLLALDPPAKDMSEFVQQVIPPDVLSHPQIFSDPSETTWRDGFSLEGKPESEVFERGVHYAKLNRVVPTFLGQGYYGTLTPEVIKRNVLENPAWYTSYTPYQAEISQGRLESLLNFQTMVSDLTALPVANASLLDEATAAAEAMTLSLNSMSSSRAKRPGKTMLVAETVRDRNVKVMRGRAEGFGINIEVLPIPSDMFFSRVQELGEDLVGVMVQYPDSYGAVEDYRKVAEVVHEQGALLSCATDLMALTILTPPGEWGADIAFGSSQRFGVPLGFGGPHAAFFAVADKHKRKMPGRLVGVSKDRLGGRALRLALQTREQHIRREKATSNVCTAQALPANVSAMYAVYHGPDGLKAIAESIRHKAAHLSAAAQAMGYKTREHPHGVLWDTVVIHMPAESYNKFKGVAIKRFNCRYLSDWTVALSVDEATTGDDMQRVISTLAQAAPRDAGDSMLQQRANTAASQVIPDELPKTFKRSSAYLQHSVFNTHRSETELLRYIHHLQSKDLSLVHSMIPLGSCTMKLNGSVEMALLTQPGFANVHPFSPRANVDGYRALLSSLKRQLTALTGMDHTTLEPNSGAQGEFAGLRAIRDYHKSRGQNERDICLIPVSAHGTNPASAAMAGMRVVPIKCDGKTGNLDVEDLRAKCEKHRDELGAIMVTYPSTFGVFEPRIKEVCEIVHQHGGQVYMDGANMNAQVGLCSPGDIGADVCHLNLHKTFCIPHGGGGPGAGPVCSKQHLRPFLGQFEKGVSRNVEPQEEPREGLQEGDQEGSQNNASNRGGLAISGTTHGSASILPISWAYNVLMGANGLRKATEVGLLNANYLLARLKPHYQILYTNQQGRCAHEFILDARPFRETAGVEAIDIAKRLQDYGFHAPTMSWPVANTLMIEPTESESKEELDRFADALVAIRGEIREVEEGRQPRAGNVLKMAPHPLHDVISGDGEGGGRWDRPYPRDKAAYPLPWLREKKFWPTVARVDDTYGDLNLFCTCPPVEDTTGGEDVSSVQTSETK